VQTAQVFSGSYQTGFFRVCQHGPETACLFADVIGTYRAAAFTGNAERI
jgi:hypothetical protein